MFSVLLNHTDKKYTVRVSVGESVTLAVFDLTSSLLMESSEATFDVENDLTFHIGRGNLQVQAEEFAKEVG